MDSDFTIRCDALLFDLDGVLVDSSACIERVLRRWAAQHALEPARVIAVAHGRRTVETIECVAPHLDARSEAEALTAEEAGSADGVLEIPGARPLLGALQPQRWAIVTSGARSVATLRLRATGLPEPTVLICAGDVAHGKPDPEGYLTAATRLGVPPDACVVVEDAPAGLAAARAAGMRSIGMVGTYLAAALGDATYVVARLGDLHVTATPHDEPLTIRLVLA